MSMRLLRSLRQYSTQTDTAVAKYVNTYIGHTPRAYDLITVMYDDKFNKNVLDRLKLKDTYTDPSKLTVIDMFGVPNGFTVGLNEYLNPAQLILVNEKPSLIKFWSGFKEAFPEIGSNITLFKKNAFNWGTYLELNEQIPLKAENQPGVPINSSLLIQGNFSNFMGAGFIVQIFSTIQNRNWYQRFGGNVRILAWVDIKVANKLIADHTTPKYRRAFSLVVEAFTETRLVGVTEGAVSKIANIDKHNPEILSYPEYESTVDPKNRNLDLCLVEILPKAEPKVGDIQHWNYVVSKLMVKYANTLEDSLWILGPAAEEHLGPEIPERMMKSRIGMLTIDDFYYLTQLFSDWAFKPNLDMTYALFSSGEYE